MSATVSLAPLYKFTGWVVNRIAIAVNGHTVPVHLSWQHAIPRAALCRLLRGNWR